MRIVLHIDVNNAFLSWTALELLEHGAKYDIRDSFAVIGGDESRRHGIVLAKSMKAKRLGIKTAETLSSARKKCSALSIYPPDYKYYQKKSNELFKLLSEYTPDIEIASIDECYLEFTNTDKLLSNNIMGNIIITEGDVLSVLKLIHDLVYYNGEYILFINDDNRGIITYLVKRANQIYNELGINVNLKIDYNKNYNSYINNAVTIIGSNDFVNTACKDFTNYNIIVA